MPLTAPDAFTDAPKRVLFVSKRPKDVPTLFCAYEVAGPNGKLTVHPDTTVVAAYRTIGHAACNRVVRACERAGVPYVQVSTGGSRCLEEIEERAAITLRHWTVKGFWGGPVGEYLVHLSLKGTSWQERVGIINAEMASLGSTRRFTHAGLQQTFKRLYPDLPRCSTRGGRPRSNAKPSAPNGDVRPATVVPTIPVVAAAVYPDPSARAAFTEAVGVLAGLMAPAGITEITFLADEEGAVTWGGREKVVEIVERGFTNDVEEGR